MTNYRTKGKTPAIF